MTEPSSPARPNPTRPRRPGRPGRRPGSGSRCAAPAGHPGSAAGGAAVRRPGLRRWSCRRARPRPRAWRRCGRATWSASSTTSPSAPPAWTTRPGACRRPGTGCAPAPAAPPPPSRQPGSAWRCSASSPGPRPASGPGITLEISDPQGQVTAAVLLDTLQELRDAGAEAMQIDSVRVVASTSFVDGTGGVRGRRDAAPAALHVHGDRRPADADRRPADPRRGRCEVLRQQAATGSVHTGDDLTVDASTCDPNALSTLARPRPAHP